MDSVKSRRLFVAPIPFPLHVYFSLIGRVPSAAPPIYFVHRGRHFRLFLEEETVVPAIELPIQLSRSSLTLPSSVSVSALPAFYCFIPPPLPLCLFAIIHVLRMHAAPPSPPRSRAHPCANFVLQLCTFSRAKLRIQALMSHFAHFSLLE